jgi:hypothetical protein
MIEWLLGVASWLFGEAVKFVVWFAKERPVAAALIVWGIIRSFGVVVQTGQAGVLFRFGRASKVLAPGFHPLIPVVHGVLKVHSRSISRDLPRQRVTTADGLVYNADTTLVFRVEDPIKAVTLVADVGRAISDVMPLLVHDVLRGRTREGLSDRRSLDAELAARAKERLAVWGLTIEQAGFSSISPTRHTVRLTQLRSRTLERFRLMKLAGDRPEAVALLLCAGGPAPVSHSAARYRKAKAYRLLKRRLARLRPELKNAAVVAAMETAFSSAPPEGPPGLGDRRK